jgi:hypothetical protein
MWSEVVYWGCNTYHFSNLRPKYSCSSLMLVKYFLEKKGFYLFLSVCRDVKYWSTWKCFELIKLFHTPSKWLWERPLKGLSNNCLFKLLAIWTCNCNGFQSHHWMLFIFTDTFSLQLFFVVSLFIAILQIIWKYKKYFAIFQMSQKLKNVFQRIFRVANK